MREPIAARMLLLQSAPSFEWRSLARWLARAGARVAARTRVSETRFRDRFDGLSARALDTLDRDLLSQFDLVIADGAALGVLDDAEFLLERAIKLAPDNTQLRIDYIQVLRKRQKFAAARSEAHALLQRAPDNPQFLSLYAI